MTPARTSTRWILASGALLAAALLVSCTGEVTEVSVPTPPTDTAQPAPAGLPASLMVSASPGEPIGVGEAQKTAKEGDEIIIRGRVGGTDSYPFLKTRAIMTIADTDNVTDCSQREGDSCESPWDYCCDRDILEVNIASVTVRNAEGEIVKAGLEGESGLKPLSVVVVKGKVGSRPEPETLEIHATAIYVEP